MKPVEATSAARAIHHSESVHRQSAERPDRALEEETRIEAKEQETPDRSHLLREILRDLGVEGKDLTKVDLSYGLHEESGRPMVVIRSRDTMEVLRTVPPEQLLNVVARIVEYVGLLMDETV